MRSSVWLKIISGGLIFYGVAEIGTNVYSLHQKYLYDAELVQRMITLAAEHSYELLDGNDEKFNAYLLFLEKLRSKNSINFYVIKDFSKNQAWSRGLPEDRIENWVFNYKKTGEPANAFQRVGSELEQFATFVAEEPKGYAVIAGSYIKSESNAIKSVLFSREGLKVFGANMSIFLFGVFLLVSYYFRGYFQTLKKLRTSGMGQGELDDIKIDSAETELLVQGLKGYTGQVSELQSENQALGNQMFSSFRSEHLSGKIPPYRFNCTLVRSDLNGYTQISSSLAEDVFTGVLSNFFAKVIDIVNRYDGYYHEFIGDEILYYFKDEDSANSTMMALAAIRDINSLAELYSIKTQREHGYPWVLKTSLAYGKLLYGLKIKEWNGFFGRVLVETVRVLSEISSKENNTVYFANSILPNLRDLVETKFERTVILKKYTTPSDLHSLSAFKSLDQVLDSLTRDSIANLTYYRSDLDLIKILSFLKNKISEEKALDINEICLVMKSYKLEVVSQEVRQAYFDLLDAGIQISETQASPWAFKRLATVVSVMSTFLRQSDIDENLEQRFKILLASQDDRVVANIVEVLWSFDSDLVNRDFKWEKASNRLRANLLVQRGRVELTSDVLKRLHKMLKASDPLEVSSALYAVGEIARFYSEKDSAAFDCHAELQKLLAILIKNVDHPHELVRKQACLASKKIKNKNWEFHFTEAVSQLSGEAAKADLQRYYFDGEAVSLESQIAK